MRGFSKIGWWGAFVCAMTACGDPYEPPRLEGIRMEGGNDQTGVMGGPLPQPLVVSAFNQDGEPIAGARVQFSAPSGTFDQTVKFSDAEGLVRVTYTFGAVPGPVTITASTLAGEVEVQFTATAEPGAPTSFTIVGGDQQIGVAGATLPNPLRVRVRNTHGVGLSGVAVTWTVAGAGQASESSSATDATGYAQVTLTLVEAGPLAVTASVTGLPALTFTATATAPEPPPEGGPE